jgi:hypothetical protein
MEPHSGVTGRARIRGLSVLPLPTPYPLPIYTRSVNVAALPYTLLLILAELSIGSLLLTLASDLRGGVTRGFVMTMAFCVSLTAALAWWTAASLVVGPDVDGFQLAPGWFAPARDGFAVVTAASAVYSFAAFTGWDALGRLAGIVGAVAGLAVVVLLSAMLAPPTWGFPAPFLALFAGTLVMGAVAVSMVWGHWYLTEGKLPAWPLRDLAWVLIGAVLFQSLVTLINAFVPVRETPRPANPISVGLFANPAFYLRVGVGLLFPAVLAVLSLRTTRIRAMQSATGLLYICMGAVFAGEVLSKGLMFLTGRPL